MKKYCTEYEDLLDGYLCDILNDDQRVKVQEHLAACADCRDYVQQQECRDRELSEWVGSMESSIESGLEQTLRCLTTVELPKPGQKHSNMWLRYAVAAAILLAAGFLAGKQFAPRQDLEGLQTQLAQSLKPAIEQSIVNQLRGEMVQGYTQLRDQLSAQVSTELDEYAAQTLAVSSQQTQELLTDLIRAIDAAQTKDRQWMVTAMNQIEENRLQDKQQFGSHLVRLATLTEDEIQRTRQEMASLLWTNVESAQ